ncbi:MAG: response regulator [Fibrobacteria bacterium]
MTLGKCKTILIVDDEDSVRRLIARILGLEMYRILEAGHGEEALSVSEAYPGEIDLLVTDIMMPIMNGKELATRLTNLRPGLGVLFISGYPGMYMPEGLETRSKCDYMAKPFRANALLDKVKALIGD